MAPTMAPEPTGNASWSLAHRVLFRFACCYFVLYSMPSAGRVNIFGDIPGAGEVFRPWIALMHTVCPWVAIHIFHLSGQRTTYFRTGSGDTTLDWMENLLFLAGALAVTLAWSVADRRRPHYRTLHAWLRLLVRYTLAFTLFTYGFVKIVPLQFQPPRLPRLVEPYGEFSPMGVLWSFMGASLAYTIFSGCAEVTGGLLLLFRRTTTLGALVSFGVLSNVVALNFCYDVPVKLYSTNLLLMALFLAAPDLRRLFDVLVRNRAAAPAAPMAVIFLRPRLRTAATVLWILFAGWTLYSEIRGAYLGYRSTYAQVKHVPIYGLYDVESFFRNGEEQAGRPDAARKVWFLDQGLGYRSMDERVNGFACKYDAAKRTLSINDGQGALTWSSPDAEHLVVEGTLAGSPVSARLRKIDTGQMLLNRGFHWISEFPYNR